MTSSREAVLHLTGWRHQGFYGRSSQRARAAMSIPDVLARVEKVSRRDSLTAEVELSPFPNEWKSCVRGVLATLNIIFGVYIHGACAFEWLTEMSLAFRSFIQ